MAQDRANIFKLDEKELKKYKKEPFYDCMPGIEDFAKALEKDINTKETPHVLLLEANYGMGKTFFCTRFKQYLENKKIKTIYFSAWENDYIQDPLIAILKEFTQYFSKDSIGKRIQQNAKAFVEKTIDVVKATSFNCGVLNIDNEKLIDAFKEEKDLYKEARQLLTDFINKLHTKKLVIIIDELDRCRPDYAMKVLEATKHFFDIEGIFFILPTNKPALDNAIKALYGITNNGTEQECYFKKFFNDERKIPEPNYETLVIKYINKKTLSTAINGEFITNSNNNIYYSLEKLQSSLVIYCKMAKLTLRQMTDMLVEIVRMVNLFPEKVQCEYLSYLMCKKLALNTNQVNLDSNHPFSPEKRSKYEILDFKPVGENIRINCVSGRNYLPPRQKQREILNNLFQGVQYTNSQYHQQFISYQEALNFIEQKLSLIKDLKEDQSELHDNLFSTLVAMEDILKEKENEIEIYQKQNGSEDNDETIKKRYNEIVEKRETLYNNSN